MKCRVIAVLGTRPEAIKLALVIDELRRRSDEFETAVVHTGQHRTMLDHALKLFKIKPDFDLDVMRPNQTLSSLTGRVLDTVENACHRFEPNIVLVQGDTTTAFASALAAYYCKIAVFVQAQHQAAALGAQGRVVIQARDPLVAPPAIHTLVFINRHNYIPLRYHYNAISVPNNNYFFLRHNHLIIK